MNNNGLKCPACGVPYAELQAERKNTEVLLAALRPFADGFRRNRKFVPPRGMLLSAVCAIDQVEGKPETNK